MSQSSAETTEKLWKLNDQKAQKNGAHKGVYWVKKRKPEEDGKVRGNLWMKSCKYTGDWVDNRKEGYGIMHYQTGDKYEGQWRADKRTGQGTLWKLTSDPAEKYKRVYTGDWDQDKMSGQGSYFYPNGDRYDGFWFNGKRHGQGRVIYANGDIFEGQFIDDQREGYGSLSKASGDYFEGFWMKDLKHGQGSYYYGASGKIYVGEWVEDVPKCGVFTEVEDEDTVKHQHPQYFTDPAAPLPIPELQLADPDSVLRDALAHVRELEEHLQEED